MNTADAVAARPWLAAEQLASVELAFPFAITVAPMPGAGQA